MELHGPVNGAGGLLRCRRRGRQECFALVGITLLLAAGATAAAPPGWEEVAEPGRFTLAVPSGWQVRAAPDTGWVTAIGPEGAITVWPIFVKGRLDGARAGGLLRSLATRLVPPEVRWEAPSVLGSRGVRMAGRGAGGEAVASLVWQPVDRGAAATFTLASAAEGRFGALRETFARIAASFRPRGRGPAGGESSKGFSPPIVWVAFQDPNEGAFATEVPRGWPVRGGTVRRSAVDVRHFVEVTSPDGRVQVFSGDPEIPPFVLPNPMGEMMGLREGNWYNPMGTPMLVKRYTPGAAFAREYVAGRYGRRIAGLTFGRPRDRTELVRRLGAKAPPAFPGAAQRMDAGEVRFSGEAGGRVVGYCLAQTTLAVSGYGGNWWVGFLFGFVSPPEREAEAAAVLAHMLEATRINPRWAARQQQTTGDVSAIVAEAGRAVSQMIREAYEGTQATQEDVARRWSNQVRDTVDVVDPVSRETYKVAWGPRYYWIDDSGRIVGTRLEANPDAATFRRMISLP